MMNFMLTSLVFHKNDSYEAVQRKYNYTANFFDIGTGAEGKIKVFRVKLCPQLKTFTIE